MDSPSDPMWADCRVLVTGAHGFIGRHTVRRLHGLGATVFCPYRDPKRFDPNLPGTHIKADLTDRGQTHSVMEGVDIVVHLAARTGGIQMQRGKHLDTFDSNWQISRQVLLACAATGVRRLFIASSAAVYQNSTAPLRENSPVVSPTSGGSGYAWSKLVEEAAAQWLVHKGGPEVVVGRITNVFGPGGSFDEGRATVVHDLIRKASEAGPGGTVTAWGAEAAVRSFLYAEDLADAIRLIVEKGADGETYNIDSGEAHTVGELARLVCNLVDPSVQVRFSRSGPQGSSYRVLDPERLRGLGFLPRVPLQEGVRRTIEAYRAGGTGRVATGR